MPDETTQIPNGLKFVFGGLAGMGATIVIYPLDLIKTRIQLERRKKYQRSLRYLRTVVTNEGILGLYRGLSAGLLRQATYGATRMGVFNWLNDSYRNHFHRKPDFVIVVGMAMSAGVIGAVVGNPAEVALVRISSDGSLPPTKRRNYRNVFNAFRRIVKEEGAITLFRGLIPTMGRAIVTNATQLTTYGHSKDLIADKWHLDEGILLQFIASIISGFITSVSSLPLDNIKTQLQHMKVEESKAKTIGMVYVFNNYVKNEGVLSLWKGLTPYFFRTGPYTAILFLILEQLNKAYHKFATISDSG